MKKLSIILLSIFVIFSAVFCAAFKSDNDKTIIRGNVVYIYDGDTVKLKTNDSIEYKIRLSGIDAPEYDQKYGKDSKEYLESLVSGKFICIKVLGTDKYDRILATIFYNNEDINYKMIKAGYAWHYKYYDNNREYEVAETEAKSKKIGLWQDNSPTAPWDYRHKKKNSH